MTATVPTHRPPTAADAFVQGRAKLAALRTMKRNVRLRRYQGRNSGYTSAVMESYQREVQECFDVLMEAGRRDAVGYLVEEDALATRVSVARDEGQPRPELVERLRRLRRRFKVKLEKMERSR